MGMGSIGAWSRVTYLLDRADFQELPLLKVLHALLRHVQVQSVGIFTFLKLIQSGQHVLDRADRDFGRVTGIVSVES